MTKYENSFTIDFGEIGYWKSKQAFRVRLNAAALTTLIEQASQGARVYELFMITRPRNIWPYLVVELLEVPTRVQERYQRKWEERKPMYGDEHPWPDKAVPLVEFDHFFMYSWDDTDPEDQCWLDHRNSPVMKSIADQLLMQVKVAQGLLDWNDPLLKHEIATIRERKHPYDYLDSSKWFKGRGATALGKNHFTKAFYEKAKDLISDPSILSVAWRGDGDYRLCRLLCEEQRKRADRSGRNPGHCLVIGALTNSNTDVESWGAVVSFFSEGLSYGDLYIEQSCLGDSIKSLVEADLRSPGRYVLAVKDEGNIEGFSKESGDGWVLYTRVMPFDLRRSITLTARYMNPRIERIIDIEIDHEMLGIFSHERVVFVVQGDPCSSDWKSLAQQVLRMEHKGGQVTVVVSSEEHSFVEAGCNSVVFVRDMNFSTDHLALGSNLRLRNVLQEVDVLFLVETSEPLEKQLSAVMHRESWEIPKLPSYVVSVGASGEGLSAKSDLKIQGSLADWLAKAIPA